MEYQIWTRQRIIKLKGQEKLDFVKKHTYLYHVSMIHNVFLHWCNLKRILGEGIKSTVSPINMTMIVMVVPSDPSNMLRSQSDLQIIADGSHCTNMI